MNLIDIGERAGSGIPNIFRVWRVQGWEEPVIAESAEPDRTVLSLSLTKNQNGDKKAAIKDGDKIKKCENSKSKGSNIGISDRPCFRKVRRYFCDAWSKECKGQTASW